VKSALGSRIAARASTVEGALAVIDKPAQASAPPPPAGAETLSGSAASTLPQPQARPRSRRGIWLGAAAALAAVGVGLFAARSAEDDVKPIATAPTLTTSTPAAPPTKAENKPEPSPASNVVITVRAEPANAALQFDSGPPLPNPYSISVVPDGSTHKLRAFAEGHAERVEQVTFDRSKEIVLVLSAVQGSSKKPVRQPPRTTNSPGPEPGPAPAPPNDPQRKLGELPTVVKKPPRSLDADNPFAKP
jgi:hypothetical protein